LGVQPLFVKAVSDFVEGCREALAKIVEPEARGEAAIAGAGNVKRGMYGGVDAAALEIEAQGTGQ
jgi:hypothetical protein